MFKLPISCKPCDSDDDDFAFDWDTENKFDSHDGHKNNSLYAMRQHLTKSHKDQPSNYNFTIKVREGKKKSKLDSIEDEDANRPFSPPISDEDHDEHDDNENED